MMYLRNVRRTDRALFEMRKMDFHNKRKNKSCHKGSVEGIFLLTDEEALSSHSDDDALSTYIYGV